MKNTLQLISTKDMTNDQWLAYRKTGIGASETAVILGLSPYKSSIELFYEKIGEEIRNSIENIFMFMGKEQEQFVADLWQYWAGSEESLITNYRANNIQRRCRRINAFVRNPKWPWLFVSLDRIINKVNGLEGALEIKTIGGYEANKWEGGIPPSHVIQVQTQIKVCEFIFGELATLTDGRRFDVMPFEISKDITGEVIEQTHDFWQRIEKGRALITQRFAAKRQFNYRSVDELTSQLASLEPPPDNSDAYAQFLKARYGKSTEGETTGGIIELQNAISHREISQQIEELKADRQLHESILKNKMGAFERMDFGSNGFISWKCDKNGDRRFTNRTV